MLSFVSNAVEKSLNRSKEGKKVVNRLNPKKVVKKLQILKTNQIQKTLLVLSLEDVQSKNCS